MYGKHRKRHDNGQFHIVSTKRHDGGWLCMVSTEGHDDGQLHLVSTEKDMTYPNLSNNMNSLIFKAVQDFIAQSGRFAME